MDLPERIDEKLSRAFTLLGSETVPAEVREDQRDRVEEIMRLKEKLASPSSFEAHLSSTISSAYRAAERGDRDEPRCTCGSPNCPILEGRVPSELRTRGLRESDTYEDATHFLMDHPGDPVVVAEAIEEYHGLRAELYSEIEILHGTLQSAREERRRELAPSPPRETPADD